MSIFIPYVQNPQILSKKLQNTLLKIKKTSNNKKKKNTIFINSDQFDREIYIYIYMYNYV